MSLRVYIAGPSAELTRVRETASAIESQGHVVTCRWFDVIEHEREGRPTDEGVPDATLAAAWRANSQGIDLADVVLLLCKAGGGLSGGAREEAAYAWPAWECGELSYVVVGDPGASPLAGWLRWAAKNRGRVHFAGSTPAIFDALQLLGRAAP
jgi:uncharacterized protein YodC (DUF2158 family)